MMRSGDCAKALSSDQISDGILKLQFQLGDLATSRHHVRGMIQMVEHNGGPQTLGSNGFLERLVYKFAGYIDRVHPVKATS